LWLGQAAVRPNPACSGHGFAVGCRWRFCGKVALLAILLDKHAVPLTPTLGGGGCGRGRCLWCCRERGGRLVEMGFRRAEVKANLPQAS